MLHRRKRGAGSEHPAAEQADGRFALADFPYIEEGGAFGGFLRRAFVAIAGDDFQRAEFHHFANRHLNGRNPGRDLVHALKNGDFPGLRPGEPGGRQKKCRRNKCWET